MNESSSRPSDDEAILAQFIVELAKTGPEVIEEWGASIPVSPTRCAIWRP